MPWVQMRANKASAGPYEANVVADDDPFPAINAKAWGKSKQPGPKLLLIKAMRACMGYNGGRGSAVAESDSWWFGSALPVVSNGSSRGNKDDGADAAGWALGMD